VSSGPANAPVLQTIGAKNPNLTVPGLCSNLLTDALIIRLIGVTDGAGTLPSSSPTQSSLIVQNTFGGAVIYTQCHALDLGRPDPIGVCNSDGRMTTLPLPNTTRTNRCARIVNNLGGTTATEGTFFHTSTFGYVLVTEFTY
jgi:hypothetical protein